MKIAIITGASSGIGKEFVLQIAGRFSKLDELWVIARREDRLKDLCAESPIPIRSFALDLLKKEDFSTLLEALKKHKPNVKILVNSSGFGKIGYIGDLSFEEEEDMIALNCQALCRMTHMVLPYMSPNSRVIQVASSAAFLPQPKFAVYAASKSFVLHYSRALNMELKERNITVTAVCPGPVRTEFFDIAQEHAQISFFKRMVMAEADNVVALALNDSIKKRTTSTYGGFMKIYAFIAKLLPHNLLLVIYSRILEKE